MQILEFLAELATDTEVMSAFRNAPEAVLRARCISEQDRLLLLSGDPMAISSVVTAEVARQQETARTTEESARHAHVPEFPDTHPTNSPPPKPRPKPKADAWTREGTTGRAHVPELPDTHPTNSPPPKPRPKPKADAWTKEESSPLGNSFVPQSSQFEPDAEPLDLELDLAQDAVLIGSPSARLADSEPGGVWGSKGLTVVGMGIRAGLHMTQETRVALQQAAKVLYLVADPISEACILQLQPNATSLRALYEIGKPRIEIYENMIAKILSELESAGNLCVAFYGHPGVLVYPAWESIRRARATGKRARMLPAISTEDTLFADLGVDIARAGLLSIEATRFLYYKYNFDPSVGLVLWQVGSLGEHDWNPPHTAARPRFEVLTEYLEKFYGPDHPVFLYHAPEYPTSRPLVERVPLHALPNAELISSSTLYIPPRRQPEPNEEVLQALERLTASK